MPGSAIGGRRRRKVLGRRKERVGRRRKERKRRALTCGAGGAVSEGGKRAGERAHAGRGAKMGRAVWLRCTRGRKKKGRMEAGRCERKEEKGGRARLGRQWASAGRGRKKGTGPELGVGLEWKKGIFFSKTKPFPNLFSLFSILSQIQIRFEFNFKSTSPTLIQKPYASA